MKFGFRLAAIFGVFFLFGCAQKSYIAVQRIVPAPHWKNIAIMPFTGSQEHLDLAAKILVNELENKTHLKLVNNETSSDVKTKSQAQEKAKELQADAYITGNIIAEKKGRKFDAFTTIDLVEAKSGRIVASAHRPSGELLATSEEECVTAATERAARDMVKAIEHLELQKPRTSTTLKKP